MALKPDLTVAAISEQAGRFLIVEERVGRRMVFNQPAGHVEDGESFIAAVIREALEETAWHFTPEAVIGIYLWRNPTSRRTVLRVAYAGTVRYHEPERRLDHGIVRTHWFTRDQLLGHGGRLRSPMVLRCVDDYLAGARHSLDLLQQLPLDEVESRAAVV